MSGIEHSKQTVQAFLEVFSSGDVARTMDMMTEDATWWVAGTLPISGTHDKVGFRKLLSGIAEACEGGAIKLTPKSFTAEADRVAVEAESFARLQNGRTYNNHYHFQFTVRGSKISGVKEYLDTMHTDVVICQP